MPQAARVGSPRKRNINQDNVFLVERETDNMRIKEHLQSSITEVAFLMLMRIGL